MIPPHPPLQSGGWYQGAALELPGPGRLSVVPTNRRSARLAVLLAVLFGPLGLVYLSMNTGLVATVVTVAALGYAGLGFLPLLALWPLAVVVAARVARHW